MKDATTNHGDNPMSIEERVTAVIVDHLGVEAARVLPTALLAEDLGADSLDRVELMMAFEEEFGIEITDEQAIPLRTVESVTDFITANVKE